MIPIHIGMDYEQNDIGADPNRWNPSMRKETALLSGIAPLRHGTTEGRAVVMFVIELADGSQIVAQTTLRNFRLASIAILNGPIASEETLD